MMVATVGPADYNLDETLSTLRYANRAKNIKNCAKINEDPKDAILRQYQEEILRLRSLLEMKKLELQEKSTEGTGPAVKVSKKRNSQKSISSEESFGILVEEQTRIEQKHRDELRALLEPYGINVDANPSVIMSELESRSSRLMIDGEAVKEDKKRIYDELKQTTKAMLDSKRQCKELFHRIVSLEGQIHKNIVTNEELKSKEKELAEQNLREANLRKTLEQRKCDSNELKDELTRLQQENEDYKKKIGRLRYKAGEHKNKVQRLQTDHVQSCKELDIMRDDLAR